MDNEEMINEANKFYILFQDSLPELSDVKEVSYFNHLVSCLIHTHYIIGPKNTVELVQACMSKKNP